MTNSYTWPLFRYKLHTQVQDLQLNKSQMPETATPPAETARTTKIPKQHQQKNNATEYPYSRIAKRRG